ncbi:glycosyltransferase family 4 protein [Humibacter ginsenosidimutans]|uniref:Glycosyltransferase family 4 protein n=1 Tax=Humibacter ginsenosidimutans TaxID=2599293 RepID=A0A5B8M655_9MICO|nr:glycosyltransferase family 4 protein [Humibacter ginsenosidimutans]QDZ14980.1 glycosyltransferase family 4 protein [Humibacter ginsenosidimutans]
MPQNARLRAVTDVAIATNNGDIGGGEVMMLRIATALRERGIRVTVVVPRAPDAVAQVAMHAGHTVAVLDADDRPEWMRALRRWDARRRTGVLWCNGLVPAVATAGHRRRVVHLHQRPTGIHRPLSVMARARASAVLVPSRSMLAEVPHARVLPNWTDPLPATTRLRAPGDPFVVGFLGRVSMDKGIGVLAEALRMLDQRHPGAFRLALGGESRFVSDASVAASEAALAPIAPITDRLGWIDPADLFDRIDLLVVPSVQPETFGLVAAEGMSARVPVLVTDAGALPEVVGDEHPLIVTAGDPTALAEKIVAASDGRLRADVDAQYARWLTCFSPDTGARHVRELLSELAP